MANGALRLVSSGLVLTSFVAAHGQQAAAGQDQLLSQVIQFAQRFHDKLPSLVCDETMLSQELHKGTVRKQVEVRGTLRIRKDSSKALGFTDERRFDTVDGLPAMNRTWKYPYIVAGAFAGTFLPIQQDLLRCYTIQSNTEPGGASHLEFTAIPALRNDATCKGVPTGYHKVFFLDPLGNVTQTVRTMDSGFAHHVHDSPYAEVHFAPVTLGSDTVWMPVRIVRSDSDGRMIATYSNFHRYSGSAVIVTDSVTEAH